MGTGTTERGPLHHPVAVLAIVAVAYFVTGRLGLLLAIAPGYATAVWLPSGIALASVLLYGYRVWPGIMLGSFLVNVGTSFDATSTTAILKSLSLAASIGLGAAVQAMAGAFLVRRFVGFPTPLYDVRDVAKFMALGGPVGCLLNATWSVTTLLVGGLISWASYPFSWWTWWVGDTMGVLTITPLVLIFAAEPRSVWRRRRLSVALPLGITFAVVVALFVFASNREVERIKGEFERRSAALANAFEKSVDGSLEVLYSIRSFYATSPKVDRQAFRMLVQRALSRHPELQALSWDVRVPDAKRAAYEQAARRDGYPAFQITEWTAQGQMVRAAQRPEYVVVSYIEPYEGNESSLGYDLSSAPGRRGALNRARDTGDPGATGRITLVQDTDRHFYLMVFQPIYENGLPHDTVEERRRNVQGYATGVFRISDMVEASLKGVEREDIELRLHDETAPPSERLLYGPRLTAKWGEGGSTSHVDGEGPAGLQWATTLDVAGRRWALRFSPTLEYLAAQRTWYTWAVLASGLLFIGLLGALLLVVTGHAARIEPLVVERTAELQQANAEMAREIAARKRIEDEVQRQRDFALQVMDAMGQGLIVTDSQSRFEYVNPAYARMLGYAPESLLGQFLVDVTPPEDHGSLAEPRAVRRAGQTTTHETRLRRRDGSVVHTLVTSVPRLRDGQVVGAIEVITDLTERKNAEEILASSEARQRALLSAIPDLIFRIRSDGTYLDYKAEHASDLAVPPEAFLGKTIAEVSPELAPQAMAHVERSLRTGQTEVFEYQLMVNGRPRDFEARIVASGNDEVVAICRDITVRLAADRVKAEFLLMVSHELRTPLTSILGALGLLADGTLGVIPKDGQEMLEIAVANADRLARIVDDVLDLERIRLDRFRMTKEVRDAWTLVVLATDAMRSLAAKGGVTLSPSGQPIQVWADGDRVIQVLSNLIGNAIKFSPRDATIWLTVERQDGQALFRVRDQGRGIPPDRLERIFERFEQVYDSDLRRQGGLGLGLFICRAIVEQHGGRIWAESTPGAGSTFSFSLPLPRS